MENMDVMPENSKEIKQDQQIKNAKNKKERTNEMQITILSYLHDLVFLLVALLLLFVLLFRIVVVSGPSMKETLHDGDYLIVLSSSVYKKPKAGDVVVVSKDAFKNGEPIVKRVIATEGQTVRIDNGKVYVDDVLQEGEYTTAGADFEFPLTLGKGYIFVMGDNRNESKDSRSAEIGIIDEREVLGKVLIIALPAPNEYTGKRNFSRIGAV